MKTREFQLDKLDEARKVQADCVRLHMISPPLLYWEYDVTDENGNIIETGKGKANSFTRNALNIMANYVGLCDYSAASTSGWGNGIINTKLENAAINTTSSSSFGRYANGNAAVHMGTGTTESLDDYLLPSTAMTTTVTTSYNDATNKLTTLFSGVYINSTGSLINFTESAIVAKNYNSLNTFRCLMAHDVFDAVSVPDGKQLTWRYYTEIAYPA